MVGAGELAEEPPIDVGSSLMWCFKLERLHRIPECQWIVPTFLFVLNLQEDQHRKPLDCINSSKFKEGTTWNKPVNEQWLYINGLLDDDDDVLVWSVNGLQNVKRSKESCRSFALDLFRQPKPSPARSSLKLTIKQEVLHFDLLVRWNQRGPA